MEMEEFKQWITEEIRAFAREDAGNRLEKLDGSFIYEEPLVGFVAGDDPIFLQLKEVIGDFHLTPSEALAAAAKAKNVSFDSNGGAGVISFILPISKETKKENAGMKDKPSERWAHTRLFGEEFNQTMQAHVVSLLEEKGYLAIAPELDEGLFKIRIDERVGFASPWSQRHVAFSASLGTFGLSDGLITASGKAHRTGSIVVNRALDSPERTTDHHRDCLAYQGLECQGCIKRCPAGAITEKGHDKLACFQFVSQTVPFIQKEYGIDIYGCGLCQCGVPCADGVPKKKETS